MHRTIIHLATGLSNEERRDDEARERTFQNRKALLSDIPGIKISSELHNACALIVDITDEAVLAVQQILGSSSVTIPDPNNQPFRAAR